VRPDGLSVVAPTLFPMRSIPSEHPVSPASTDQANDAIRVFLLARGGRALRPPERAEYDRLLDDYVRALHGRVEQAA
jgi:hypothetical protein